MCTLDFDGVCPVWVETEHRSAKDRKCDCCWQPIVKGERYLKHRSMYDGNWWSEACCLLCHTMRREFAKGDGHMLTVPSSFREYLFNCVELHDRDDPWMPLLNRLRARIGGELYTWQPDGDDGTDERYAGRWV